MWGQEEVKYRGEEIGVWRVGVEQQWENYPNSVLSFLIDNVKKIMAPASRDTAAGEMS